MAGLSKAILIGGLLKEPCSLEYFSSVAMKRNHITAAEKMRKKRWSYVVFLVVVASVFEAEVDEPSHLPRCPDL